jgi:hypothetical protein
LLCLGGMLRLRVIEICGRLQSFLLKSQSPRPASTAGGVGRYLQQSFASNKPQVAERDLRLFS